MKKLSILQSLYIGVGAIFLAAFLGMIISKTGLMALVIVPALFVIVLLTFFITRNPEFGWFLIVFFLPFERVPSFNIAGMDLRVSTVLGILTLFFWILALMFNSKKYKLQIATIEIPLMIFIFALILSLTQALNLNRAITVFSLILFMISLLILTVNMVNSRENLTKTIKILFYSSFVVALFGFFQFGGDVLGLPMSLTLLKEGYDSSIFGFPRIQAFSMEPLYLANFLMIPLGIGLALVVNKVPGIKRNPIVVLMSLLLIIFILTVSRGGYLGLAALILILFVFFFKKFFTFRNIITVIIVGSVVVLGVYYALSRGQGRALGEFIGHATLSDYTSGAGESTFGRLDDYKRGLDAWKENPVLGKGIGNFGPWIAFYPNMTPVTGWKIVNNQYIELLAETGTVGLASFLLIIVFLTFRTFIALKRAKDIYLKSVLIGLFAAVWGILVQYNFFSTLYIIHIWIAFGLLIAVQNIILNKKIVK